MEILGYKNPQEAIRNHVNAEDKGVGELPTPGGVRNVTIINESGLYNLILSVKLPNAKKFNEVAMVMICSRTADAIKVHVDKEDKGVCEMQTPGGVQNVTIINESGLYSLILSSKMPNAKKFKRWVTSEVLPAIRKHGVFAVDTMLNDPDAMIAALQAYKEERQRRLLLESENAVQKQQLLEMKPKVSYYDVVINSPDLISITEIAKDYGWSAKHMNGYLHSKGIQYKQGDRIWILYQKYAEQCLTSTKTHAYLTGDGSSHTKVQTYWTQKGRLFIYDLLKKDGILPLIEKENMEGNQN